MFNLGERFGTFLIAAALLFAALRIHKSNGKHSKATKPAGVIAAFLAGLAFLVTFVGGWIVSLSGAVVGVGVAGLIVCAVIVFVDWFLDGRPDRPAFWAAFFLAFFLVVGVVQIPKAAGQVGDGGSQVSEQIKRAGR